MGHWASLPVLTGEIRRWGWRASTASTERWWGWQWKALLRLLIQVGQPWDLPVVSTEHWELRTEISQHKLHLESAEPGISFTGNKDLSGLLRGNQTTMSRNHSRSRLSTIISLQQTSHHRIIDWSSSRILTFQDLRWTQPVSPVSLIF